MPRLFWLLLLVPFHLSVAWAQRDLPLTQFNQRAFTIDQGAPGATFALAQTSDGTLWAGSTQGLFRFDGARFVRHPQPEEGPISTGNVWSLFATRDGGLWVGYRFGGASFLKDGVVTNYGDTDGLPAGAVIKFELNRVGELWVATQTGLARLVGSHWEKEPDESELKTIVSFLIDRRDTQWAATPDGLFARRAGQAHFRRIDARRFLPYARGGLAESPDGKVWASTQEGLIRFDARDENYPASIIPIRGYEGHTFRPLMFDREGNLWGAPLASGGVLRVRARQIERADSGVLDGEFIMSADKLSTRSVLTLFEDREGNVWSTSAEGIKRFTRGNFVRDLHECPVPAVMAAADHGGLWLSCRTESVTWLLRDGVPGKRWATSPFTAAHTDHEGTVWFAGPRSIGRLQNGEIEETLLPSAVSGVPIQALLRDRLGGIWLSATTRGLFRFSGGAWSRDGGVAGLPSDPATSGVVQPDGTIWLGYRRSRVARIRDGHADVFGPEQGLDIGTVLALAIDDAGVWVGGERGIARFGGSRFSMISESGGEAFGSVSGIVSTHGGDLWLNSTNGIFRIARAEISHAAQSASATVRADIFDYRDGLAGVAIVYDTLPSAIEGSDGRLWFATTAGLVSVDVSTLIRSNAPPPVTIWSLTSDERRYAVTAKEIRLPVGTTRLQIEYSAGTLTTPERVHFKHRLEGMESAWHGASNSREATYTNLGPGHYRFHVIAANQDGVWNEEGASVTVTIPPAWYQTTWFKALCLLAACAVLVFAYRLRVQHVSARIVGHVETRMAERERIARELHDTLLQSFQGLVLRLQTALHVWPSADSRRILADGIDQAADAITEGRNAVQGLRSSPGSEDLEGAIHSLGQKLASDPGSPAARFRVQVQGRPRALQTVVWDETFRIVGEAMRNAFRHAAAKLVDVDIRYGKRALSVFVRDDGKGIDQRVVLRGLDGHFGLRGMRERANLIGGKLTMRSRLAAGTEVELTVPAARAFASAEKSANAIDD